MVNSLLRQIFSMMIMIACGFLLVRFGKVKSKDAKVLSAITIYLILPCVVINSFQVEMTEEVARGFLGAIAAAVLYHVLLLAVCRILRMLLRLRPVEEASVYYSNAGNMIIPLAAAVLGEHMVIHASAFFCVQTIFMWTHGHALISGHSSTDWKNLLKNPNLIAVGVGLVMFVSGLRLPELLQLPVNAIASIVGPVSMITIGMVLTRVQWRALGSNRRLYLVTALRMLVVPAGTLLVLAALGRLVPLGGLRDVLLVSFLAISAPSAVSVMQLANLYRREEVYTGLLCASTTLVCILTMPLMTALYLWAM